MDHGWKGRNLQFILSGMKGVRLYENKEKRIRINPAPHHAGYEVMKSAGRHRHCSDELAARQRKEIELIEIVRPATVVFSKGCRMSTEAKAAYIINHSKIGEHASNEELIESVVTALEELEEMEPTRTVSEVETIVKCIRAGIRAEMEYVIPENPGKDTTCW